MNGSLPEKGCVGKVSGAVGAMCEARRHAARASRGEPRDVHLRMSSTGCPACPSTLTPSTLHSYGLVTDLKESRNSRTRLKRCGCRGIWGSVRLVGSARPGITSTRSAPARRAKVSSASCNAALETAPVEPASKTPPQTITRCTASLAPPSPRRKATARARASARPSLPSASLPKARPDSSARKGPSPSAAGTGSGGGEAILGKQMAETLKWPSSVADPRTPTMAPVGRLATCSPEAISCRRMELSSSHRVSLSVWSLCMAMALLFSRSAVIDFMSLYCSMTLGRPFNSLKSTPMITASPLLLHRL
mmetsp:Transcript_84668/g.252306  ORF Transcript_84668/g.252306 Transcript_84668/m.252306 type:complete len:306 (+) Transcript_84668:495-1412(+)